MTVPSTTRKAGPYTGNGVQTVFPFSFKVFSVADVTVTQTDTVGVDATLTSGYVVTLNPDQVASPGGSITLSVAPPTGYKITATGALPYDQTLSLPGGGNFNPTAAENAFDRVVMQLQQVNEKVDRAIKSSVSTPPGVSSAIPSPSPYKVLAWNGTGTALENTDPSTSSALAANLSASSGSSLVGHLPSGAGAVATTVQSKLQDFSTTTGYPSIQAALDANPNKAILLVDASYTLSSTLTVGSGQRLIGFGPNVTTVNYTGTGTAIQYISPSGTGIRIYGSGAENFLLTTSTGATGIDCDSLSSGQFADLIIAGFATSGLKHHTPTSGGSVYNRHYNVKAQSCGVGFDLVRDGGGLSSYTNDNTFIACRANICTTGFNITGGNHNIISNSQIEGCTTGVYLAESGAASCSVNTISLCRFEGNTSDVTIGALVTETILQDNFYVNGNRITDSGTRTQSIGAGPKAHIRSSGYQLAGGSFRYVRTANGGTEVPHTVFNDASSVNSPVTVEIQNTASSLSARALRVRYGGDAGAIKFGIVPISGKITDLATTNGPVGSFICAAAASTTINNTCVTSASVIFLQAIGASAGALQGSSKHLIILSKVDGVSFTVRTADSTAAAGTEGFQYWIVN
jgi:hypothetical protein